MYQSMMLEVNKKVYMEPDSLRIKQPDSKKSNVRDLINKLLSELTWSGMCTNQLNTPLDNYRVFSCYTYENLILIIIIPYLYIQKDQ